MSPFTRFNPLQVQTKLVCLSSLYQTGKSFNPLQVQTKLISQLPSFYILIQFQSPIGTNKTWINTLKEKKLKEFQSPIGTNKTLLDFQKSLAIKCFNPLQVQTKLKYIEKPRYFLDKSFNPLQVQTKLLVAIVSSLQMDCFNPLQVQTKLQTSLHLPYLYHIVSIPYRYKQNCDLGLFGRWRICVSIPYRYKQNVI